MAGIYLHIPFCRQACHYCDFHFSTSQKDQPDMTLAICRELELQKNYLKNEVVTTIYFGGGTPSMLTDAEFEKIFKTLNSHFNIKAREVTVEANPEDLTYDKLLALRQIGVNRLSIGIQSFDDKILSFLNRNHNGKAALESFELSRKAGFSNISIDLIYAIPGQPVEVLEKNIQDALLLNPEHISAYSLTIEKQTVFGNWHSKGKLTSVGDDVAAVEMERLADRLAASGYEQYEVSNFGKPGFHSMHNSNYWKQEKYLGVGPSAHSYDGISRQFNVRNNSEYMKALKDDKLSFQREVLTIEDNVNEYLMTTLRTQWGCDMSYLRKEFAYDLTATHHDYLETLFKENLAAIENDFLKLTSKGRLLADKIASDLFMIN
jgi:oxygen-independent coproporphyrinogen-3 oxidase